MHFKNVSSSKAGLVVLAIMFPMLYIGFSASTIVRDYRTTLEKTEADVRSTSAALNEHATRAVGEADRLLQSATLEVELANQDVADEKSLHEILAHYSHKLPQVLGLSLITSDGKEIASGLQYPLDRRWAGDRDVFLSQRVNADNDLVVSGGFQSIALRQPVFTLARRLDQPPGRPALVIVAYVPVAYFQGFYRSLHLGKGTSVMLLHRDGWMILDAGGEDVARAPAHTHLFQHYTHASIGSYRTSRSLLDETPRIVGYAGAPGQPLISVATISQEDALAPWWMRVWQTVSAGVISIAVLFVLITALWRRLNDLMEGKRSLEEKNETLALAAQVFDTSLHAIMILSPAGVVMRVNQVFTKVTGYTAQQVVARNISDFSEWFSHSSLRARIRRGLLKHGAWQGEAHVTTRDGRDLVLMQSISNVRDVNGRVRSIVAIFHDITEQKRSQESLHRLAHFDTLTNLPNRRSFTERIERGIEYAIRTGQLLAVIFIDIDHFKTINDSMGHACGDKVLQEVADRLSTCLRYGDTLARIGGDEFVALLEGNTKRETFEHVAAKLALALTSPITVDGREVFVAASMGISVFPSDGRRSEDLLRNADTAMYRAKAAGRNCWRFFDESMAHAATHRLEIETALRRALVRNEFSLHYQAQHSLASGRIVGAEALIRWQRPDTGWVGPSEFIPLAEESGLIHQIGEWVLSEACMQAAQWWREYRMSLRIAINITARQIYHKDFVASVQAALHNSNLPPHLLELEITESSIIEHLDETIEKLHQLKAIGVTLAIDDFGTGYSSLSYLKRLPVDRLKIDRSFVKDTPGDSDDCAIVRTIISMSHNLGLAVIAEGVETQSQLEFLKGLSSDEIQGFLLGLPMPGQQFGRLLAQQRASTGSETPRLQVVV